MAQGVSVDFSGVLKFVKKTNTKTGKPMAFAQLECGGQNFVNIQIKAFETIAEWITDNCSSNNVEICGRGMLRNQWGDNNKGKTEIIIGEIAYASDEGVEYAEPNIQPPVLPNQKPKSDFFNESKKPKEKEVVVITDDDLPF